MEVRKQRMLYRRECLAALAAIVVVFLAGDSRAQPDAPRNPLLPANRVDAASDWKMESLKRKDGRFFQGLVQSQGEDGIVFVEVKREKNKPLYLVIHHYPTKSIETITRLSAPDQAELRRRIQPLLEKKSHARIEAGRMEDLIITEELVDDRPQLAYRGEWFDLTSSADEETTRRCVVRLEQIFRAYQQVLPPQTKRRDTLQVRLHGSMDEYRDDLQRRQLEIQNPAFFSTEQNLIVAGSELTQYGEQVALIRQKNAQLRRDYEQMDRDFRKQLDQLRLQLKQNGFTDDEITAELRLRNAKWKADNKVDGEYWEMLRKINAVDRANDEMFHDVTRQMFRRLFHESFHAYLEDYVFPNRTSKVPRWLNEGLAQVFENSQLDGDTLRIDAPDRELLAALQKDLISASHLPISQFLETQDQAFLVTHDSDATTQRHYLYSWGLAYYLTFEKDILNGTALGEYVSVKKAKQAPAARFEEFVGIPMAQFEVTWRLYILNLKSVAR